MDTSSCSGSTPLKAFAERGSRDRSLQEDRQRHASPGSSAFRSNVAQPSHQSRQAYHDFIHSPGHDGLSVMPSHGGISPGTPHMNSQPSIHQSQISPTATLRPQMPLDPVSAQASWVVDFTTAHSNPMANVTRREGVSSAGNSVGFEMHSQPSVPQTYSYRSWGPQMMYASPQPQEVRWAHPSVQDWSTTEVSTGSPAGSSKTAEELDFDGELRQWSVANRDLKMEQVDEFMDQLAREFEIRSLVSSNENELSVVNPAANSIVDGSAVSTPNPEDNLITSTTGEEATRTREHSDISDAARQLLDVVQHEGGDKWKKSQFLMLMRDFRDGTKDIVDNEIREKKHDS